MKTALTVKFLDAAKPGPDIFDAITPGLCVRVSATKKSWCFVFTPPGGVSRTRMGFGTYPATDLASARAKAVELRGQVEAGKDPRIVAAAPQTVSQLVEDRMAMEVRGKLRSATEVERRYNRNIVPLVGKVAVADFRIDPHYNKVIDPLVKAGKLRMAAMLHSDLVCLMAFAVRRGVIEYSRIAATEPPQGGDNVKTRFLTVPEIKTVWQGLPKAFRRSPACVLIVKLLLATGQRCGEVSGAHRSEFDWDKLIWTIPAERVKNGRTHQVPLSPLAAQLFREAFQISKGEYAFPNKSGGPLLSHRVAKTIYRSILSGDLKMEYWTAHDLRRTVGTQMLNRENGLGISKVTKYMVLNHSSGDKEAHAVSDRHYDGNTYIEEKREALDKWGTFLANLVGVETGLRVAA